MYLRVVDARYVTICDAQPIEAGTVRASVTPRVHRRIEDVHVAAVTRHCVVE